LGCLPGGPRAPGRFAPVAGLLVLLLGAAAVAAPKYFFRVVDVRAKAGLEAGPKALARELVAAELGARPEFTADLEAGAGDLEARLKQRKLQGFDVVVQVERLVETLSDPRPGGRLKQLTVDVKLTVFGTTIPGAKLAFSGDGEAQVAAEIVERRREEEAAELTKEALTQAIRQAVDEAVRKLALPRAAPVDESKRRRKRS
jgi:hypothetical protein